MEWKGRERERKFALLFSRAIKDYILQKALTTRKATTGKPNEKPQTTLTLGTKNCISTEADYAVTKGEALVGFLAEGVRLEGSSERSKKRVKDPNAIEYREIYLLCHGALKCYGFIHSGRKKPKLKNFGEVIIPRPLQSYIFYKSGEQRTRG